MIRQEWPKPRAIRKPKPTGFPASVKATIAKRSGGMCELDFCGPADHFHHRAARGRGGTSLAWVNRAANALHVALACHDRIEVHRTEAYVNGWLVSRNGTQVSARVPVLRQGVWVLLDDAGGVREIEGAA
jgi:hypothetical protein